MAKVQGKKAAAGAARRATRKVAVRAKSAGRTARKAVAQRVKKAAKAVTRKATARAAKPAKPLKAVKPAKPAKRATLARPVKASKPAKAAKASKPAKSPKPVKAAKAAKAAVPRPVAVPATKPKPPAAPNVPPAPAPAEAKKGRTRRPRPRIHSDGAPVAAWLRQGEKPRPSSFIPAPARAEGPSLIAAPPASSDRLIRPEDVTEFVTRTVPIRVAIEQGGGRAYIGVNPEEVTLRPGEGIEWDFRYIGGADVTVEEVVIEMDKPSPFSHQSFRSRNPGTARPHRQLSGPVRAGAAGDRIRYTIRAMTAFKTELAVARPNINVTR